jgi:hypothetical protein
MSDKAEVPNKTNTSDVSTLKEGGDTALNCLNPDVKASNADNNRVTSFANASMFKCLTAITDLSKRWYYDNIDPITGKERVYRYFAR